MSQRAGWLSGTGVPAASGTAAGALAPAATPLRLRPPGKSVWVLAAAARLGLRSPGGAGG